MSKPVTPRRQSARRNNNGAMVSLRRARTPTRALIAPQEMGARRAWAAAVRVKKAVQDRIVFAFRKHIEGSGPGPSDAELRMFATLAVAEHRLEHSLARAKVKRCCVSAQTHRDLLHRGEHH